MKEVSHRFAFVRSSCGALDELYGVVVLTLDHGNFGGIRVSRTSSTVRTALDQEVLGTLSIATSKTPQATSDRGLD
jgi:hypothetical protein